MDFKNFYLKISPYLGTFLMIITIISFINLGIYLLNVDENQRGLTPDGQFWAFMSVTFLSLTVLDWHLYDTSKLQEKEKEQNSAIEVKHVNERAYLVSKTFIYGGIILSCGSVLTLLYILILVPYEYLNSYLLFGWILVILCLIGVIIFTIGIYMAIFRNAWAEINDDEYYKREAKS